LGARIWVPVALGFPFYKEKEFSDFPKMMKNVVKLISPVLLLQKL
jgi:hypothetical protein